MCHISAPLFFLLHRPPRSSSEELGDIARDVVHAAGHREGLRAASELVCWYQGLLARALVRQWAREGSRHERVLLVYGVGCVFVKHLGDIAGEGD